MEIIEIHWDQLPFELDYERLKSYLRVFDDSNNSEHEQTVLLLVKAAIEAAQTFTRQTFVKTQFRCLAKSTVLQLAKFPVLSVDKCEARIDGEFVEVALGEQVPFSNELTAWNGESWGYHLSDCEPPVLQGPSIPNAIGYRVTWTAGFDASQWPKDLTLLIAQAVEENFDNRGSTPANAQSIRFSRAHELVLAQYCSHHDALRWA